MTIAIYRQTEDGRMWFEAERTSWDNVFSFIPNWGHVWVRYIDRGAVQYIEVVYGKVMR